MKSETTTTTTTVLRPFLRDHPGEPVPEENFWTLWCKGRLTEADTQTVRLGATSSGLTSAQFPPPPFPHFLQAGCPYCRPTSAQLGGSLYHAPKLHPGPCSSVGVWPRTDRQTDRHTDRHTESGHAHTDARDHNTFCVVYDSRKM